MPTALYELASSSVPEEAVTEAFELAQAGQVLDQKTAKAIKAKYKALKGQTESIVQSQNVEPTQSSQIETKGITQTVDSVSELSSGLARLPEKKDKAKHEILAVVLSEKAVKNSWWQLGEHNKLFCGEPKSEEFLKRLPQDIALKINFLPQEDYSLIPQIESIFSFAFHSKYDDLLMDHMIEESFRTGSQPNEIVVFCYIYQAELLKLVEKYDCRLWIAEPDLEKCEQILTMWREKGSVMRIKN